MRGDMFGRAWPWHFAATAIFAGAFIGTAMAQTAGPEETIDRHGIASPELTLTDAQKSALYNVLMQQRVRASASRVPLAVGAAVPPSATLFELPPEALAIALPDQGAPDETPTDGSVFLKYAMVEGEVVVIDPIRMRVVDVIHRRDLPGAVR